MIVKMNAGCLASVALLLLWACYQPTPVGGAEIITNFTSSVWSNVRSNEVIAYLNTAAAGQVDGCSSVPIPSNSKHWILLLEDFNTCPFNKIAHAREAGYVMLFMFNRGNVNSQISDTVEATGFPVVILSEVYAANVLQESSNFVPGTIFAKISHNVNTTVIRITIYADDSAERVTTAVTIKNSPSTSSRLTDGGIAGIVIAILVFLVVLVVIAVGLVVLVVRHREKVQDQESNFSYKKESNEDNEFCDHDKKGLIQQE